VSFCCSPNLSGQFHLERTTKSEVIQPSVGQKEEEGTLAWGVLTFLPCLVYNTSCHFYLLKVFEIRGKLYYFKGKVILIEAAIYIYLYLEDTKQIHIHLTFEDGPIICFWLDRTSRPCKYRLIIISLSIQ